MNKSNRLRKRRDFTKTYKRGKSISDKYLVLVYQKNRIHKCRIGISVSKKLGKAVKRNKIKRRIKEITRNKLDIIKQGYDIVFIARKYSSKAEFTQLENSVERLLRKAELLVE